MALTAEGPPDFSGTWLLEEPNSSSADVPRRLNVRQLRRAPIPQNGRAVGPPSFAELVVEREFADGVKTSTYRIGVEGGVVGGVGPDGRPLESRFSVRFDLDNRLIIETANHSGPTRDSGPFSEHTEIWSLDETGRLLMTIEENSSEAGSSKRTATYRRTKTR